jgi:cell division protein FtsB
MTKEKRNNYKFWHSPFALLFLFGVLVLFGYKIIDLIRKNVETAHKKELILEQIDELENRESSLSSNLSKLDTEEGKEEIIRGKYQVAKEGEKMVTIVDDKDKNMEIDGKIDHGFWNWIKKVFNK